MSKFLYSSFLFIGALFLFSGCSGKNPNIGGMNQDQGKIIFSVKEIFPSQDIALIDTQNNCGTKNVKSMNEVSVIDRVESKIGSNGEEINNIFYKKSLSGFEYTLNYCKSGNSLNIKVDYTAYSPKLKETKTISNGEEVVLTDISPDKYSHSSNHTIEMNNGETLDFSYFKIEFFQ